MLYTKKATETQKGSFGLKERLLFCLLELPLPPRELMSMLNMAKTNLALLANKCIQEGLIEKTRRADDRRTLTYSLTEKGRKHTESLLNEIESKFHTVITNDKERQSAADSLDAVTELLSYLP